MKVSPDDPRSIRTREVLHEALMRLAAERSIATLTVGDLTGEAGLHRSTFYLHYSGIPELLEDCAKELFEQLRRKIYSINPTETQLDVSQMVPYVSAVFYHLEAHELFYRAMLGRHGDPLFRALFQAEITDLILEPKVFGGMNPQREMILRFFSAGFTEIAIWWLEKRKPLSAEEAATLVVKDLLTDYVRFIYD